MMNHSKQNGFTLFEVMIAVLVLSIGLLGLAGLQISGLRHNKGAYEHSQAMFLAYEIADRMRANATAAKSNNYLIAMSSGTPSGGGSIANQDLAAWLTKLGEQLPSGDGEITRNGDIFTIVIQWADMVTQANATLTFETQI